MRLMGCTAVAVYEQDGQNGNGFHCSTMTTAFITRPLLCLLTGAVLCWKRCIAGGTVHQQESMHFGNMQGDSAVSQYSGIDAQTSSSNCNLS